MATDNAKIPSAMPPTLIELNANGETAQVLCFGKSPYIIEEILFKGPSGIKIKVTKSRTDFPGDTTDYTHVGGHSAFTQWGSVIFYEQSLPIPIIYVINGIYVAGLADDGPHWNDLKTAIRKEFEKLPTNFYQGLRELYLFCIKLASGVRTMVLPLAPIFENLEGYKVEEFYSVDPINVKAFQEEFYGK
jgi:hypothetical protein